jgi:hypothetical protein
MQFAEGFVEGIDSIREGKKEMKEIKEEIKGIREYERLSLMLSDKIACKEMMRKLDNLDLKIEKTKVWRTNFQKQLEDAEIDLDKQIID